ncbi:hypothetical protein GCM10009125_27890 [Castellaniella daejeonensis]|uniref:DUF3613 domain-containing protein n=1 Tax=Castellaniella daejeonensis TaxID=659013 RepID=A0ABN0U477_9BURK
MIRRSTLLPALGAALLAAAAAPVSAQTQTPLVPVPAAGLTTVESHAVGPQGASSTAQSGAGLQTSAAASTQPEPLPAQSWPARTHIGAATQALMDAQVAGTQAGPVLPTLGAAAGRSWKRYLDSFDHPIPDRFEETVQAK